MSNRRQVGPPIRPDGQSPKKDMAEYMREYQQRETYRTWRRAYMRGYRLLSKVKDRARDAVRYAIDHGTLNRPDSCSACLTMTFVEAHHHDYSKPLEVSWLCVGCHKALHRRLKK